MGTKKLKVINWSAAIDKITAPYNKQLKALFKAHEKESKGLTTAQANELWRKKYKTKYEKLELRLDAAVNKFYYKYHTKDNRVKAGYILKH